MQALKLNKAQERVIAVLSDYGGWVSNEVLEFYGASASSATALARDGLIEQRRKTSSVFWSRNEWRLKQ